MRAELMPERRRYERTPDTLIMLAVIAIVGTIMTLLGEVPTSIYMTTPRWAGLLWSAAFSTAALVSLIGVLHREPLTGWLLELAGRAGLLVGAFGYVVALAHYATNLRPALQIGIIAGIGISAGWRVYQLTLRLRALRAALKASQR